MLYYIPQFGKIRSEWYGFDRIIYFRNKWPMVQITKRGLPFVFYLDEILVVDQGSKTR